MTAGIFDQLETWPVDRVAAAIVTDEGVRTTGDPGHTFRIASLTKPMAAWAVLIAVEEGVVDLDGPLRHVEAPDGATMRHLLSHAAGFPFEGPAISPIERSRMYSNTGFERAADEVAAAAAMPFADYLHAAVFEPLEMDGAELRGSPAHDVRATIVDVARFLIELRAPRLLAASTHADAIRPQYPALGGIVPGVGRFDPCPWGLGVEIKGEKSPHWMGATNSRAAHGHFGGSGTMMWADPEIGAGVAAAALTDRPFDEWADEALRAWPAWSDAVVHEAGITD